MELTSFEIDPKLPVSEIVARDYRTAEVFRRYGIGYCCGGKWPLNLVCEMQDIDMGLLLPELKKAMRTIPVSNQLGFAEWDIDFLISYIQNIHHQYLKTTLPVTAAMLNEFAKEHTTKFPWLENLERDYLLLAKQLAASMQKEEDVLFPYIRQLAHAHKDKEPYALLLVRTLRKPVEEAISKSKGPIWELLLSIREISNNYVIPGNVCASHKVVMAKLGELDNDISQHLQLEQTILFPRAIAIEKDILSN